VIGKLILNVLQRAQCHSAFLPKQLNWKYSVRTWFGDLSVNSAVLNIIQRFLLLFSAFAVYSAIHTIIQRITNYFSASPRA